MTLIRQIEVGIEAGAVKAHLVRKALKGKDINTRGLGYAVMAEAHLRALMTDFKPKAGDPVQCFQYLLECIKLDLEWDEDYAHSREDAVFELPCVLGPFWASKSAGIDPAAFWQELGAVLKNDVEDTVDDVFDMLDDIEQDAVYHAVMSAWANDPKLAVYAKR